MLNQIFPGLSTRIFHILYKFDENNHLNSSCRSQSWPGLYISPSSTSSIWIHSLKQHEFLHVFSCFWYTFLTQKVIWQKEKTLWPTIYTINVGTRKRLHDIPRFSILFLRQKYLLSYTEHAAFLYLFSSGRHSNCFSRSTSGWASDRLVGVCLFVCQTINPFNRWQRSEEIWPYIIVIFAVPKRTGRPGRNDVSRNRPNNPGARNRLGNRGFFVCFLNTNCEPALSW